MGERSVQHTQPLQQPRHLEVNKFTNDKKIKLLRHLSAPTYKLQPWLFHLQVELQRLGAVVLPSLPRELAKCDETWSTLRLPTSGTSSPYPHQLGRGCRSCSSWPWSAYMSENQTTSNKVRNPLFNASFILLSVIPTMQHHWVDNDI